jgi:hypothetical protein
MPSYRTIAIAGATAAVIIGAGTAALATSGDTSGSGGTAHSAGNHRPLRRELARHAVHGQVVTHNAKNGYVTHDAIRGTVTAVSSSSLTVKASDGYVETFTIGKQTHVRLRTAGTRGGKPGTISDVKTGATVGVLGRVPEKSTANPTATIVLDGIRK